MNCLICQSFLEKDSLQIDIFYTSTTHTNTLLINFIKKILNWNLNDCNNLRCLCQLCYNLLEDLDFAELSCSNLKKQLNERGTNKFNAYFKDGSTQTCDDDNLEILSNTLLDTIKTETNLVDFEPEINQNTDKKDEKETESLQKKTKPYECAFCQKKFTSKSGLTLHTQKQHKNETEEIEDSIPVEDTIKLEVDFDQDETFKSDPDYSDSNDVDESLTSKNKLKKNKDKSFSSIKPLKYPCPQCPKKWRTLGELKNHIASHSSIRPYICEICGQAYKHKQALDVHIGMHNGVNPFSCQYCNKAFTQKGALRRHLPIHTGEAPFQCDLCGKRFVHHTSFNMHTLAHTGQKSFKCDICGLALLSGSHLKRHKRVHTGERPYACTQCGKRFAERYNLVAHQKLHEAGPSEISRLHRCQVCGAGFDRRTKLEEHLSNSHNKIGENESDRKWIGHFVTIE